MKFSIVLSLFIINCTKMKKSLRIYNFVYISTGVIFEIKRKNLQHTCYQIVGVANEGPESRPKMW